MNIKSLLIGSAAALVAVSGARAADAVVAEPEAVEYVRVCDAYGAGFFYIPGTETCLKIGGYLRYQIDFADGDNGWKKAAKADLQFTASNETELGTLTSYIELAQSATSGFGTGAPFVFNPATGLAVAGKAGGSTALVVAHAWVSLGGLMMGVSDTLWDWDMAIENDSWGGAAVHFMRYTFTGGNGFSASLGLEVEDYDVDYVPNIVGKLSYSAGMVSANLWAAYDDNVAGTTADEFSVKANVDIKASDALSLTVAAGYNSGASFYSNGYDWSVGAAGTYTVNDKLALTLGGQYLADKHGTTADAYNIGAVVDYKIVSGLSSKLALNYSDTTTSKGAFSGFLRFQRSF